MARGRLVTNKRQVSGQQAERANKRRMTSSKQRSKSKSENSKSDKTAIDGQNAVRVHRVICGFFPPIPLLLLNDCFSMASGIWRGNRVSGIRHSEGKHLGIYNTYGVSTYGVILLPKQSKIKNQNSEKRKANIQTWHITFYFFCNKEYVQSVAWSSRDSMQCNHCIHTQGSKHGTSYPSRQWQGAVKAAVWAECICVCSCTCTSNDYDHDHN